MTAFSSSTRTGSPLGGKFSTNDTFTDSAGNIFECTRGGYPGIWQMSGITHVQNQTAVNVGAVAAAVASTVSAVEYGAGTMHQTVLTLTDMPQTVVNGTEFQGTKLYTFPEGRIFVLGCIATLAQKTTSVIASTINASVTGAVALGTVVASNVSLTGTMVDLAPSTAFTSSAAINVAGTAVTAVLAAAAAFDGHTSAKDMFLNSAYATTTDVDADGTQTWTGTVTVSWVLLGDF